MSQASGLVAQQLASRSQGWFPKTSPKGSLAKGKSYWVIALTTSIPTLADYANGFKAAGDAVGAKVTVYDGKGTPAGAAQGINSAIAAHADGIVTVLIDPKSIVSAVDNAKAAHVPIIEGDSGSPTPPYLAGIDAGAAQDQPEMGRWEIDYALKATNCKLHALLVFTPGNVAAEATYSGFKSELAKLCPAACTSYDAGIAAQDVATQTAGVVENALRLHPDINAILEVADPFQPYVATALAALGKKTPVITTSSMGDLANTGKDTTVIADVVYPPGLAHGWFYMTAVIRLLSGEKSVSEEYPIGLVDASNRDADDPSSYSGTSPFATYQAEFKKLWGVAGT
jgi:ribose transport system substrate-binding protein